MRKSTIEYVRLDHQRVAYRLVSSSAARKLRVRVGPTGVEVVRPQDRSQEDVAAFLDQFGKALVKEARRGKK